MLFFPNRLRVLPGTSAYVEPLRLEGNGQSRFYVDLGQRTFLLG